MKNRSALRVRAHGFLLATVAVCLCGSVASQETEDLKYVNNRDDPVQQMYARVVLGYVTNQKCRQLDAAAAEAFYRHLSQATVIFQEYVAVQNFVPDASQATQYTRGMILGAARYVRSRECDPRADESVRAGYKTAQDFVPTLRGMIEAPAPKR